MNPAQPTSSQQLSLGDRTTTSSTPRAINYAFRHRGSVVMTTGAGVVVRLELYQRRELEGLSLRN